MRGFLNIILVAFIAWVMPCYIAAQDFPFRDDIKRFKEKDLLNPPPQNAILLIGSSSFTIWNHLEECFPDHQIINRAFGGSTIEDLLNHVEHIVFPYRPRQILIYCGENDLALTDIPNPAAVTEKFISLFSVIRDQLPDSQISYISMKPSPSRWHLAESFIIANKSIESFILEKENIAFINIWDVMMNENNKPDSSHFLNDMLHMNEKGYRLWQEEIKQVLIH